MVEEHKCSFCGKPIEPGTGLLYVKKDGTTYYFCKSKCKKNLLNLKRVPSRVSWIKKKKKG
jgi:large subunit ribosomal protein L24e